MAWDRIKTRYWRLRAKADKFEKEVKSAWDNFNQLPPSTPVKTKIKVLREVFRLVKEYCETLKLIGEEGVARAKAEEERVKELLRKLNESALNFYFVALLLLLKAP